jgi:sugar/nucleoside kinase (ribokinase family)
MKGCLVIGAAMLDITLNIHHLPKTGDDLSVTNQSINVGGCAYNAARILQNFHRPFTLFAPIGTGPNADIIKARLQEQHIVPPVQDPDLDNGACWCLVEADGERTFLTLNGAECFFKPEWFENLDSSAYSCVYVSSYELEGEGHEAILTFLERHPDLQVFYAPGPRIQAVDKRVHERIFALHPILHLNQEEACSYSGYAETEKAADFLKSLTEAPVIITLGKDGCLLAEKSLHSIPGRQAKVKDTIGAGDSHIGAVMAGWMDGKSLLEAAAAANLVSAMVVETAGPSLTQEQFDKGIQL